MLFNLKIESINSGFPINTPIGLAIEVNTDKMLIARASCMGVICHVEPLSPFANKELSTEERAALKAERQANLEAENNGGVPSKETLIALRLAYDKAGHTFKAAETYELQNELYPESDMFNSIAVLYNNAGATDKAIEFYEKALEENPNHKYANANLGSTLRFRDPKRAKECLQRAISVDPSTTLRLSNLVEYKNQKVTRKGRRKNSRKCTTDTCDNGKRTHYPNMRMDGLLQLQKNLARMISLKKFVDQLLVHKEKLIMTPKICQRQKQTC